MYTCLLLNAINSVYLIFIVQKPDLVIFVMDSSIDQAALDQADVFKQSVAVGAVIFTKMDGHAKGGVALGMEVLQNQYIIRFSFAATLNKLMFDCSLSCPFPFQTSSNFLSLVDSLCSTSFWVQLMKKVTAICTFVDNFFFN